MELAVVSSENRCVVFHTAVLAPKTTRNTQGVGVMTLKPKRKVDFVRPAGEMSGANLARYRAKSLPLLGAVLKPEDKGEEQISLF